MCLFQWIAVKLCAAKNLRNSYASFRYYCPFDNGRKEFEFAKLHLHATAQKRLLRRSRQKSPLMIFDSGESTLLVKPSGPTQLRKSKHRELKQVGIMTENMLKLHTGKNRINFSERVESSKPVNQCLVKSPILGKIQSSNLTEPFRDICVESIPTCNIVAKCELEFESKQPVLLSAYLQGFSTR